MQPTRKGQGLSVESTERLWSSYSPSIDDEGSESRRCTNAVLLKQNLPVSYKLFALDTSVEAAMWPRATWAAAAEQDNDFKNRKLKPLLQPFFSPYAVFLLSRVC